MRPLKNLTFDAVRCLLSHTFLKIPDRRAPERVRHTMHDTLMAGFAMMFFQHPSLLDFQRRMKQKRQRCNLETIFGVSELPSDTQMREILDGAPTEPVRHLLPVLFERVRRTGWATRFVTRLSGQAYYTAALDATQYFHSPEIECPKCLSREDKFSEVHYSHTVVSATLVRAGSHQVLPIDVEEVSNSAGCQKQDCEITAAKRLIHQLRREHRQLPLVIMGDDLYAHEPFVAALKEQRMRYVLVAKPSSHKELFEWVEELDCMQECEHGSWEEGPAAKRRFFQYRIARQVPLSAAGCAAQTFVEAWEFNREGRQVFHSTWVTDLEVTTETVADVVRIGRSRWKIENEQFNVQKNHGYELEHNYGHGKQTLSMIFYLLNLLAFVVHSIIELGDELYRRCRARSSRRELWNSLRMAMHLVLVESWRHMLLYYLEEAEASP